MVLSLHRVHDPGLPVVEDLFDLAALALLLVELTRADLQVGKAEFELVKATTAKFFQAGGVLVELRGDALNVLGAALAHTLTGLGDDSGQEILELHEVAILFLV